MQSSFVGFHDIVNSKYKSDATPLIKIPAVKNEYVCNVASFDSFNMICNDPWMQRNLISFVQNTNPDRLFIHHFLMLGIDTIVQIRKIRPKMKIILTLHEFLAVCNRNGHLVRGNGDICSKQSPFDCNKCFPEIEPANFYVRNSIFNELFNAVDLIVTPTKFMHKILIENFSIKNKLRVISNGSFNNEELVKINFTNKKNYDKKIGFFGQVLEDKGVLELLKVFEKILHEFKDARLEFNGSGLNLNRPEFIKSFSDFINKINISSTSVVLKGAYKNVDVVKLMSSYKVVVFPSTWPETFSLVLTEAILAGVICVVPRIGAFIERSKEKGSNILLYSPNDLHDLHSVIVEALIMDNPSKLNSINLSKEKYSIESMTNEYINL
jgi:glycosyltransferase involved in cell wall biosynthesis